MEQSPESRLGQAYRVIYATLSGRHHTPYPWHFQWLPLYYLHRNLRPVLAKQGGRVLDVGCGQKPYESWIGGATEYVGIDVFKGPKVDVAITPDSSWPFPNGYFDVVMSIQVLEHTKYPAITLSEMNRVVRPGGLMILSFPFLYNEHGAPDDYHRFSLNAALGFFPDCSVIKVAREGGIGSTLAILWLNWIDAQANLSFIGRLTKGILLPLWIPFCFLANIAGLLLDKVDRTKAFYGNVFIVFKKNGITSPISGA